MTIEDVIKFVGFWQRYLILISEWKLRNNDPIWYADYIKALEELDDHGPTD